MYNKQMTKVIQIDWSKLMPDTPPKSNNFPMYGYKGKPKPKLPSK